MAIGLGMVFWLCLLFSPLAFVKTANAQDADSYGTVIGIVSRVANGLAFGSYLVRRALADSKHVLTKLSLRIWAPHTLVSVLCRRARLRFSSTTKETVSPPHTSPSPTTRG